MKTVTRLKSSSSFHPLRLLRATLFVENINPPKFNMLLTYGCRCAVCVFGWAQTWTSRHAVNSDAVSYLDIGDAYFRGDWNAAVNSMWSPLYSWLLGAAMFVFQPSIEWEYPVAHFVNFGLYLFAFFGFEIFLREIRRDRTENREKFIAEHINLPEWVFSLIGYLIFVWATLVLIKIKHIVPDLCVAAIVFLTAGLLVRLRRSDNLWLFVLFGIVLGIGYLAKAPLLPIGSVFFCCLFWMTKDRLHWRRNLAVSAICFAVFAAPFIIALSLSKNKITFSENGRINYAWHVNSVKKAHWQGEAGGAGTPVHATRKILDEPAVYEFGSPIAATYPVWYDPSYWYEGVELQFDPKKQTRKIVGQTAVELLPIFSFYGVFLAAGFFILLFFTGEKRVFLRSAAKYWFLLIPSLAAILMYLLIHVESRYVAPFAAIILVGSAAGVDAVRFKNRTAAIIILVAAIGVSIFPATFSALQSNAADLIAGRNTGDGYVLAAQQAKICGVEAGDKIASVGRANDYAAIWARLTKTRIVAEIYEPKDVEYFWQADKTVKEKVFRAFAESGAKFIVARNVPAFVVGEGWQRLLETDVYIYSLKPSEDS